MKPSDQDQNELHAVDEAALNEYLRRDSAVSQRYRELDAAAVPPSLDHAVLARAKAALDDKKLSRWRGVTRWSAPLALAASVVVVVSVVMQPAMRKEISRSAAPAEPQVEDAFNHELAREKSVAAPAQDSISAAKDEMRRLDRQEVEKPVFVMPPQEQPAAPSVLVNVPASAPPPAVEKKQVADRSLDATVTSARRLIALQESAVVPMAVAPPPPVPEPTTAIAGTTAQAAARTSAAKQEARVTDDRRESGLSEVIVTGSYRRAPAGGGAGPRGTVPRAQPAAEPEFDKDDPRSWLDHIRQLRADGETRRADGEWRRFRRKYPDFVVEQSDTARPGR